MVKGEDKRGPENYRLADGQLDVARVRRDFAAGYTVVMDGVERYARAVASLARSIEVELNFPIQVNAYLTPPGSRGLVPHYDGHDVLILQVQGSKTWHVYDGVDIPPREMQRGKDTAVAIGVQPLPTDVRLAAGDVLYLPRGRVHAAETTTEQSIHLTVGIHAPTVLMLAMAALYSRSFRDDFLSTRLPPRHLDDAQLQQAVHGLLRDALKTVAGESALAGGLDTLAEVLVRRGQCPPIAPISNAAEIDEQTRMKRYQPLYSWVKADADGVELQFATLSVRATADHGAAMRFVSSSTGAFRVGDLPGLSPGQQIELARSLIVSGFLVRVRD